MRANRAAFTDKAAVEGQVGNRSNASSEVEFDAAEGFLVGQNGRGIATILEMGMHTRLDCANGSAGITRAVLTHALHHTRERSAFGRRRVEQPAVMLMTHRWRLIANPAAHPMSH